MQRCVSDIRGLLDPAGHANEPEVDVVKLWDEQSAAVDGGVSYEVLDW